MNALFPTPQPSQASDASPGRRARRSAAIRESLFGAALDLFAAQGFAETTVEDITEAADVGKGTFFNYFPSKEHLLIAFSDMQLSKLECAVELFAQGQDPMPAFLRSLFVQMAAEPARNPSIVRALLQANLSSPAVREIMRANHTRAHALVSRLVHTGQQRGEIRGDIPAAEIADVFRQTIFGTLLMWSVYGDSSLSERTQAAFDLLWSGIAPRQTSALAALAQSSSGTAPSGETRP